MIIYDRQDIPGHLQQFFMPAEIGLEETPEQYVARLVEVFREVRRVLADDGTLWVNLGDSYARAPATNVPQTKNARVEFPTHSAAGSSDGAVRRGDRPGSRLAAMGAKPKDLLGIPWMVAFALRADGWWLRSDIVWAKPNPVPESVTDRPTRAHEYLFLLSKSERYWYDHKAIAEPMTVGNHPRTVTDNGPQEVPPGTSPHKGLRTDGPVPKQDGAGGRRYQGFNARWDRAEDNGVAPSLRNKRDVWTVASQPFAEAHFATMPPELVRPCVLAGCPKDGVVLDPFGGAGTVPLVARQEGRAFVYNDLNPAYRDIAERRLADVVHQTTLFGAA